MAWLNWRSNIWEEYFGSNVSASSSATVSATVFIKRWVAGIEVLGIEVILNYPQTLAKTLEVDYLSLTQELYGIAYVRIVSKTQDVVIGGTGFLFSRHILDQISYGIALGLEVCGSKRNS